MSWIVKPQCEMKVGSQLHALSAFPCWKNESNESSGRLLSQFGLSGEEEILPQQRIELLLPSIWQVILLSCASSLNLRKIKILNTKCEIKAISDMFVLYHYSLFFPGLRVEVSMVTEMTMSQLRSHPLHGEWSLLHHPRRMFGFGDHNKVKPHILMILQ